MTRRAAVALGSNLGDRLAVLQRAHRSLGQVGSVVATSSLYETAPVGGPSQDDYLNAVVVVDTVLEPEALLERLLSIESSAGRTRGERWGPRILDLDLIAMTDPAGDSMSRDTERLTLPHPRAGERRFVLEPLAEAWPDAPVGSGATASERLTQVEHQQVARVADRRWHLRRRPRVGDVRSVAFVIAQVGVFTVYAWALVVSADEPRLVHSWALVVALAGLTLALSASRSLGSALSPSPEPVPGSPMVEWGPYRWMRHPIYAGIVVFLGGVAAAFAAWWAVAVDGVLAVLFTFKARHEEERLQSTHPGYAAYMRRVRGRLVPWRATGAE